MIYVTKAVLPDLSEYTLYLKKIWKTHWLTNDGVLVKKLEKKLSKLLNSEIILVNSGTLGLQIALKALNLKGEVITTPFTFAATTNAIVWEGLTPVFADIDPDTFNIDPISVESMITKNTSAILAVHVYGNPCNVEALSRIAKKHGLKLIFDAAHAFNVSYKSKSILEYGDVSVLSFHATKTFHTIEGGAIATKKKNILKEAKLYRNFGIKSEEEVVLPGINAKMNEFQAAMGLTNLPLISHSTTKRKKIYELYVSGLQGCGLKFQKIVSDKSNYTYMPIVLSTKRLRDSVYQNLLKKGIHCRKYFYPLTSNSGYLQKKNTDHLVNANAISNGVLCLPIYDELAFRDVKKIIELVKMEL